jgi:hypothetical protein
VKVSSLAESPLLLQNPEIHAIALRERLVPLRSIPSLSRVLRVHKVLSIQQNISDFIDVSPHALDASLRCFQLLAHSMDRHSRWIVQFMLAFFLHMLASLGGAGFDTFVVSLRSSRDSS